MRCFRSWQALPIALLTLAATGCGTTSTRDKVIANEHRLEGRITGEAKDYLARTWHLRRGYVPTTACRNTTPDGEHWLCTTTVSAPLG